MRLRRPIPRWLLYLGAPLVAVVLLLLVLVGFRVPISLGFLHSSIVDPLEKVMGRDVAIDGSVHLIIGPRPAFQVRDIRVANPGGWGADPEPFMRADRVAARVGLRELLRNRIDVDKVVIDGFEIHLREGGVEGPNWQFVSAKEKPEPADHGEEGMQFDIKGVAEVSFTDFYLKFTDGAGLDKFYIRLDEINGTAAPNEEMGFAMSGSCLSQEFSATMAGGTPADLFARDRSWPFALKGRLGKAEVSFEGTVPAVGAVDPPLAEFELQIPDLRVFEPVAGPLPDPGPVALSGQVSFAGEAISLPELDGRLGDAILGGHLKADFSKEIPRFDGFFAIDQLDWTQLAGKKRPKPEPATESIDADDDDDDGGAPVIASGGAMPDADRSPGTAPFTGRLDVVVEKLIGRRSSAKDVVMTLDLREREADFDFAAVFAGSQWDGGVDLVRRDDGRLAAEGRLEGFDLDVGELVRFYDSESEISGTSEEIRLSFNATGEDLPSLREHPGFEFVAGRSYLEFKRGEELGDLRLDSASVIGRLREQIDVLVVGLFKEEAFSIAGGWTSEARAPAADGRSAGYDVTFTGAGAKITAESHYRPGQSLADTVIDLEAAGERFGDLSAWLKISPDTELSYGASARLAVNDDGWRLEGFDGQLGENRVTGKIGRSESSGEDEEPIFMADLQMKTFGVDAFQSIFLEGREEVVESGAKEETAPESVSPSEETALEELREAVKLDLTLFPGDLQIANADIHVNVDRFLFRDRVLGGLELSATMRDGWIQEAPFEAMYGETKIAGNSQWDFRRDTPEFKVGVSASGVDVGRVLKDLGVADDVTATAEELKLSLQVRGGEVRDIFTQSDLTATLKKGSILLHDSDTRGKVRMDFDEGSLTTEAGETLRLELKGSIADEPLTVSVETDGLSAFGNQSQDMGLHVEAELARARLVIDERVALPLDPADFSGRFAVTAERLEDLEDLLDVDLPPIGPLRLDAEFGLSENGYRLADAKLRLGKTDLAGRLDIQLGGARPRIDGNLTSRLFRINDLHPPGWTPYGPRKPLPGPRVPGQTIDMIHAKLDTILSREVLTSFDGKFSLKADTVISGEDRLGGGTLNLSLQNGTLRLREAAIDIPGGDVKFEVDYGHSGANVDARLVVKMRDFDYGIIARRKKPDSKSAGRVNVDMDIRSISPQAGKFFAYGNGTWKMSICPTLFEAEGFDLWATNLVLALLPRLDPERRSRINCMLFDLVLKDGVVTPNQFVLDATRVRAEGQGTIDFRREKVDLTLVPRAKQPQLLSLETALRIDGDFSSFSRRVTASDAIQTVAGASARTVLFPLRFLTEERMPEDGSDICPCLGR